MSEAALAIAVREEVLHDLYYDLARASRECANKWHVEGKGTAEDAEFFGRIAALADRLLENHK